VLSRTIDLEAGFRERLDGAQMVYARQLRH
jgi:hypothetical protein